MISVTYDLWFSWQFNFDMNQTLADGLHKPQIQGILWCQSFFLGEYLEDGCLGISWKHIQVVKHGTKHLRSHNNTHQWLSCLVQPLLYHADILSIHNLHKSFKCLLSTRTSTTHRKLCFQSFFLEQPLENGCLAVVVPWKQEPRWTFRQTKTGHLDHTNTKQFEKQVQDSETFWSLSDTDYIPTTDNTGAFDTSVRVW